VRIYIVDQKSRRRLRLFVVLLLQSIQTLSEVSGYLLAIRDANAEDLIAASPAVRKYVERMSADS